MNTYIVLVRGVNIGGNNLLPMKELKKLMADNGLNNVKTYIQSGNIVVSSPKNPELKISALIESNFGFKPHIIVLSNSEYKQSIASNPYQEFDGKFVHIYFCKGAPKVNMAKIEQLATATESYKLIGNVFYLHAPDGIGRSKLVANIDACLGTPATGRNLNTVNKLKDMVLDA